ncbi:tail fiber assembly protein [Ewingella americana]|uniref:tail fiber assembly protein n=1 Tax=Ewingella americana TaxID=41202 RepID=UPI0012AD6F13|nr:tail fiber assembly protein [Ewingella americana]MRT03761.1 tail fiber assembly protein [Ewingella americana]
MKNMSNFKLYTPSENNAIEGVLFLKDEKNNDWYESQKDFESSSIKIAYNSDGIICAMNQDVSKLWPINLSVAEFRQEDVPKEFVVDGNWIFDGKSIKQRVESKREKIDKAELERKNLISKASAIISPLQDAIDLNMATDEEQESYKAWKLYRVQLSRVDTSLAPDISWPTSPE